MSDPHGVLATPVTTLARNAAGGTDLAALAALVEEHEVVEVVVGLPKTLRGSDGPAVTAARAYGAALAALIAPVPVVYVDERLTTVSADRQLAEAGVRGRRGGRSSTRSPRSGSCRTGWTTWPAGLGDLTTTSASSAGSPARPATSTSTSCGPRWPPRPAEPSAPDAEPAPELTDTERAAAARRRHRSWLVFAVVVLLVIVAGLSRRVLHLARPRPTWSPITRARATPRWSSGCRAVTVSATSPRRSRTPVWWPAPRPSRSRPRWMPTCRRCGPGTTRCGRTRPPRRRRMRWWPRRIGSAMSG